MNAFELKTQRLGLRLLEQSDIDYLAPLEADSDVKAFFPDKVRSRSATEEMIQRFLAAYEKNHLPHFVLFDLATNEFIGRAGFGLMEDGEIEVGYVLHKKFWGQGYATEAVAALLDYARAHINTTSIIAYADINNVGSFRVMEKCGMHCYDTKLARGLMCRFYRIHL